jgi:hypothetical protein
MTCTVLVGDHGRYQEPDERRHAGEFKTAREAVATCQRIVRKSIKSPATSGQTADEMMQLCMLYGDDPYIVASADAESVSFSASEFARAYCRTLKKRRRVVGWLFWSVAGLLALLLLLRS